MGIFKSTRYKHFYTQGVSSLNGNYLPDPISTYGAMGIVKGGGSAESIINGIQHGAGFKLKQYYQYATLRYKNRNFISTFSNTKFTSTKGIKPHVKMFKKFLPEESQLHEVYSKYSYTGAYHFHWLQKEFGIDSFNQEWHNIPISLGSLDNFDTIAENSSGKSWIVGYVTTEGVSTNSLTPVVVLHPDDENNPDLTVRADNLVILGVKEYIPKKSIGLSYFTTSQPKKFISEERLHYNTVTFIFNDKYGHLGDIVTGAKYILSVRSDWEIDTSEEVSANAQQSGTDTETLQTDDTERITTVYIEIKDVGSTVQYDTVTEVTEITYDKEEFIYALEDEANSPLSVKLSLLNKFSRNDSHTFDTNIFKFYPYIPVKESTWLWGGTTEDIFDYSQSKLLDYSRHFNEEQKKAQGYNEPERPKKPSKHKLLKGALISAGNGGAVNLDGKFSWKGMFTGNAGNKSTLHDAYFKYVQEKEDNKKNYEQWVAEEERRLSLRELEADTPNQRLHKKSEKQTHKIPSARKFNRESQRTRKVKFTDRRQPLKKMSNQAVKRHLEHLGGLLNAEIHKTVASIHSQSESWKLRRIYLMPAVNLNTNHNDVVKYWWTFFNRIYYKLGDGGLLQWENQVQQAKTLNDLSLFDIGFDNVAKTFTGHLVFAFIQKFEMEGTIRTIKHKRDVMEIRRGKPFNRYTLNQLKQQSEPLRELAKDTYYTSNQGKQWNIGGDTSFKGSGANHWSPMELIFSNYNYTFICKQIGENKLSVIAIAGLACRTDVGYNRAYWGTAWYDLDMQYQRNKQKYLENKSDPILYSNEYRESKRHYQNNQITTFFQVPLDYNTVRRMGGVDLERFAQRAVTVYTWHADESKFKAKWVATTIKIVGIIIAIVVAVVTEDWSGSTSQVILTAVTALVKAIVTSIVVQIVIKGVIMPLLKALGIKGIMALIIIIVVAIIASYASGYNPDTSSMPYASQTAVTNVASQVTTQTTTQATSQITTQALKQAVITGLKESMTVSLRQVLMTGFSASVQAINAKIKDEQDHIASQFKEEANRYTEHLKELEEKQEEFQSRNPSFDTIQVLKSMNERFKVHNPATFFGQMLDTNDVPSSYQYLESFLSMKLNLTPETFDSISSLDFSLPLNPRG